MKITHQPSPNFGPRRHGRAPDMVVLHHTAMATCAEAVCRLCDRDAEVSAHYVVSEKGEVFHLVDEEMRAWHAGAGQWGAVTDVNSHSIGIELANPGPLASFPPFESRQMDALEILLSDMLRRWQIDPKHVIAHSDMAPTRKFDPGAKFDWRRLALSGLSVWPETMRAADGDFHECARRFGYGSPDEQAILSAFRMRFRPGATGPVETADIALAQDLATRFAVDLIP